MGGMTAPTLEALVTAEEFARLPDPRRGERTELVRGRVVTMARVGPQHGDTTIRTSFPLAGFAYARHLGSVRTETGYWLSSGPDDVRTPDLSFISTERMVRERIENGFSTEPPDLAVEVVSPNDTDNEIAEKVQLYLDAGVSRVWVVRPEQRTVTVHRPGGDNHTFRGADALTSDDAGFAVEGFSMTVLDIFDDRAAGG